ncbi:MAG: DUF47 family protein [Candidatus Thermoplasmatota archaeon]|nr:DUF47 family protein [Candidatus Thermoplasmatota archaeon]
MVNYSFLKRLLVIGEKQLLEELSSYMDLGTKSCESLKSALANDQKISESYESIRKYEKAADDLTMKYRQEISNGAISSTLMATLGTLVEKCDSILDASYFIVREIKRMGLALPALTSDEVHTITEGYGNFSRMLDYEKQALLYVDNMLNAGNMSQMREERKKIEELEEKVDDFKDSFIDSLYSKNSKLSYITFSHLADMVHKIDDLLDHCEDISDLILTVTTAVTK